MTLRFTLNTTINLICMCKIYSSLRCMHSRASASAYLSMCVCLLARAYENVDDVFIGMQHANVQQLKRRMLDRKCIFAVKQRSVNPNVTYSLNRSAKQLFRLIHLSFIFLYEISRFNMQPYTCQMVCCLFFTLSPPSVSAVAIVVWIFMRFIRCDIGMFNLIVFKKAAAFEVTHLK